MHPHIPDMLAYRDTHPYVLADTGCPCRQLRGSSSGDMDDLGTGSKKLGHMCIPPRFLPLTRLPLGGRRRDGNLELGPG